MTTTNRNAPIPAPRRRLNWNDPGLRAVVYQFVALVVVALVAWFLVSIHCTTCRCAISPRVSGFLDREAGFAIGETPIAYSPSDTYGRAILVGVLNTLRVAVIGIVLATLLGTLIGIGRLSKNWLVARLTSIYVEVMRNVPLLLQLFFWYALITENMPGPRQAHNPCRACSSPIAACAFPAWKATRWTGCWAGWRWPSWPSSCWATGAASARKPPAGYSRWAAPPSPC